MISNKYKQLAVDAADEAFNEANEESRATVTALTSITFALLHMAEVIENQES
ncbi:hypothetical protein ACFTWH_08370 [Streptomyces sp. NPDC057011]|uniref:hypothetical protein n=1 Tax=unclassified Streptomyces TaxID=2593676 RepID=UPI00362F2752